MRSPSIAWSSIVVQGICIGKPPSETLVSLTLKTFTSHVWWWIVIPSTTWIVILWIALRHRLSSSSEVWNPWRQHLTNFTSCCSKSRCHSRSKVCHWIFILLGSRPRLFTPITLIRYASRSRCITIGLCCWLIRTTTYTLHKYRLLYLLVLHFHLLSSNHPLHAILWS